MGAESLRSHSKTEDIKRTKEAMFKDMEDAKVTYVPGISFDSRLKPKSLDEWVGKKNLTEHSKLYISRALEDFVNEATKYLSRGMLIDAFTDHETQRRPWRHYMHSKYGNLFAPYNEENALKGNHLSIINTLDIAIYHLDKSEKSADSDVGTGKVHELINHKEERSEKEKALRELHQSFPDISKWNEMSLADKLETVQKIRKFLLKMLEQYTVPTSPEEQEKSAQAA